MQEVAFEKVFLIRRMFMSQTPGGCELTLDDNQLEAITGVIESKKFIIRGDYCIITIKKK